jgi:S1-C subfamily serine protease
VITQVDGNTAGDETALIRASLQHQAGDAVEVLGVREGAAVNVAVVLG